MNGIQVEIQDDIVILRWGSYTKYITLEEYNILLEKDAV
jgi:hypothetical protein